MDVWLIFAPFGVAIGIVIGWFAHKIRTDLQTLRKIVHKS